MALTSRQRVMAQPREDAVKQMLLELGRDEPRIPIDSALRKELVKLMAAAVAAVHKAQGERSDARDPSGSQDQPEPS